MPLLGEIDNRFNGWPEVTAIDIRQSSYYNILTASGYTLVHPHKQDGMLMTGKVALRSFTG